MEPAQEVRLPTRDPELVRQATDRLLRTLSNDAAWGFATHSTGGLADSFQVQALPSGDSTLLEITNRDPALTMLLQGTGLYGRGAKIRPKHAHMLAWRGRFGQMIFRAESRGINPLAVGPNRRNMPQVYEALLRSAFPEMTIR